MTSDEAPSKNQQKVTYKDSGVDIEKADQLVDWMKEGQQESGAQSSRLISGIGGFAALFDGSFPEMKSPLLVSSTDGIGTKLLMGIESGRTQNLAQDLVGMCVNDLLCSGATPLFFLDYFATSHLEEDQLKTFITCLRRSCLESGVALIGGETAEVPGLYSQGHFDAAGFSVGVVDKDSAWSAKKVKKGDVVLGLKSSGFHSNGFSLLRKIFGEDGGDFADELMAPTKLYWPLVKKIQEKFSDAVHSAAHITGGGMDNLSRVLPEGLGVVLESWSWPSLVSEAQKLSGLDRLEMLKTFNCGLGFALIVSSDKKEELLNLIRDEEDFEVLTEGEVVESETKWIIKES